MTVRFKWREGGRVFRGSECSLDVDKEFLALALLNEYAITYCLVCLSGVLSNSELSTKK